MKNKIVLDSCVFSKQFLKEQDSHQAKALIEKLLIDKIHIIVPQLWVYEVLATVSIGNYSAIEVYGLMIKLQKSLLHTVELDEYCVNKIIDICKTGHTKSGFPSFYDSSYHALAILNDCYFVTADKKHFSKTQQLGHIVLLNDWETAL
ncbi:MAG: type II toxin-antitoxin system VapC family toxin [Methylovulum sp.]|uniref:type II toxin-antitoxin system VapC family toxin n=1 Tax=Methylovulum sp. TaxID=1916980 RepID=UPI00262440D3|nr:type II toxin-antitoxin system VapC family toxin [Methylovulum sp.]MDD2722994.1 type II toxin-antitoxin system VapC family toxin [Methylovulum sp.]